MVLKSRTAYAKILTITSRGHTHGMASMAIVNSNCNEVMVDQALLLTIYFGNIKCSLKMQFEKERKEHEEAISDTERSALQDKERLKKEITSRIEDTRMLMLQQMDEQLNAVRTGFLIQILTCEDLAFQKMRMIFRFTHL